MAKLAPYVALFFGLILAAVAVPDAVDALKIAHRVEDFRSTRAQVLQQTTRKPQRGPEKHILKFKYSVGDRVYERDNHWTQPGDDQTLFNELVRREKDGTKTVLVYYDPDSPGDVVIRKDLPIWFAIGVLVVTSFLVFGSLMSFWSQRKKQAIINRTRPNLHE